MMGHIYMVRQADGALQGSAGEGIDEIREQIMGVVSTAMWGEFNGAGMMWWYADLLIIELYEEDVACIVNGDDDAIK